MYPGQGLAVQRTVTGLTVVSWLTVHGTANPCPRHCTLFWTYIITTAFIIQLQYETRRPRRWLHSPLDPDGNLGRQRAAAAAAAKRRQQQERQWRQQAGERGVRDSRPG